VLQLAGITSFQPWRLLAGVVLIARRKAWLALAAAKPHHCPPCSAPQLRGDRNVILPDRRGFWAGRPGTPTAISPLSMSPAAGRAPRSGLPWPRG